MIFPRYHQLDAVRKIIAAARDEGPGRNYLIQHSAGSGKTNSISWLSHRLASLHDDRDQKVGDNDRIVTRYMADQDFQGSAFPILAREIFEMVRGRAPMSSEGAADSGEGADRRRPSK